MSELNTCEAEWVAFLNKKFLTDATPLLTKSVTFDEGRISLLFKKPGEPLMQSQDIELDTMLMNQFFVFSRRRTLDGTQPGFLY